MQFTKRLATHPARLNFPLPIHATVAWQPIGSAERNQGSLWRTSVALPALPESHIVVPSFACLEDDYQYQWVLSNTVAPDSMEHTSTLAAITASNSAVHPIFKQADDIGGSLSAKIDCWHTQSDLPTVMAYLTLWLPHSLKPPEQDLMVISLRPIEQAISVLPNTTESTRLAMPCPISQMQAEPSIAKRICSPTATAMAVAGEQALKHWPTAVKVCLDPHTKAYGKWPLAIYWASQNRRLGSVEALANWPTALTVLKAGSPIVCSIRFDKDALPGAPLQRTDGHLVVLYGVEFEGESGFALVMDPAAESHAEVARRYPLEAFSQAWLGQRGGAYLFSPTQARTARVGEES